MGDRADALKSAGTFAILAGFGGVLFTIGLMLATSPDLGVGMDRVTDAFAPHDTTGGLGVLYAMAPGAILRGLGEWLERRRENRR